MEVKTLKMQYGHADGHTSICYSTDGQRIITCGTDGDVRTWTSQDDGDPVSECVGEVAIALAFYGDHFYVGSDTNYVQGYTFPDAKRDGIISRFTAPVTHISISQEGTLVAASSCDMEIQVADTENSNAITKMVGHTAPVTGVAIDPMSKYLASSSCDGSIKIWDLKTGDVVKTLPDLFPKCNDFLRAIVLGRPSWQCGNGRFLAVPTGKQVCLYDRDSWSATVHLSDPNVISTFSLVEFSCCGNYLAASTTSGDVVVWDVSNQVTVASYVHPKKVSISCLAWRPDGKELAICDRLGQFATLDDVLEQVSLPISAPMSPVENIEDGEDNGISLEEIKRSAGWGSPEKDDDISSFPDDASVSLAGPRVAISINMQPPFQPSSTPTHFQHRFMVWNGIGTVRNFNTEEEKSIDIEFHDTMFHHALHINNYEDYTIAALSSKVLALASTGSDDSSSKLTCVLLNAWDGSKEWVVPMPDGEHITAVAAGGNWVAASTDLYHLRIFSSPGTQRQPLSVPGQVVCLAGHEEKLAVIYHQGIGAPDSQNLGVVVHEINNLFVRTLAPPQPLPLPPTTTLKWAGFTDEGRLCSFDSTGVLRCQGADMMHWGVLADTRSQTKGPSDNYFVIGVSERYQNIRGVLCKGSFYPMTTPRPTVVEIPLKLPLCEQETEKSELEEAFWRLISCLPGLETISQNNFDYQSDVTNIEKTLKQTVIKLFANACKGDLELRATEVAALMPEQPLQMAAKYASKCGKMHLAERLSELTPVDWADLRQLTTARVHSTAVTHEAPSVNDREEASYSAVSQRDIFEDTPTENKLLLAENQDSSLNLNLTPTVKNPFKVKDKLEKGPKGLSFFDKPVPAKVLRNEPLRNPALSKKVSRPLKSNKSTENSQPKKPNFMLWFSENKPSLSEEFPEMSLSDLTKKGMMRFREVVSLSSSAVNESFDFSDTQETQITETQKRKLEDSEVLHSSEKVKKVASDKLSMFSFHSK